MPLRSTDSLTARSTSARFSVSLIGSANVAAPPLVRHTSNTRVIFSGVTNGRAASCTATKSDLELKWSRPARTESLRSAPPATICFTFVGSLTTFRSSPKLSARPTKIISSMQSVRSNAAIVCAITGFPLTSANNLSKPIRSLLPAATMIALSMELGELLLHFGAERFAIGAARDLCLHCFHDRAHLRFGAGADFGNRLPHNFRNFVGAHSLRQIRLQDRQLLFFFRRQLGAPAFLKTFDRILTLLHLFTNHLGRFGIG